jgi:NAD(P)-dependent dehydrogenase (short-subunit alcohol dehydrogenase family)
MSTQRQVALVTGAGSGIGRAVCHRLLAAGQVVVGLDLNEDGLQATFAGQGDVALAVPGDVSRNQDMADAVRAAVETYGGLDMAVNCAGLLHPLSPVDEITDELFDLLMNVNVKGVFLGLRHQIPALKARGGGSIVNIASVAGLRGAPMMGVYSASKHAVIGLTRSAATENAAFGIRINAVCPGLIDTPMMGQASPEKRSRMIDRQPMGRLGTPQEIAEAVHWLLSPASSYCTGTSLTLDGGFTA